MIHNIKECTKTVRCACAPADNNSEVVHGSTAFDLDSWQRVEFAGLPIYVRGDQPCWFVPNTAGDQILKSMTKSSDATLDIATRRFLERLPVGARGDYPGRAAMLKTEHLKELWFHVTNRCNLSCTHCLFSSWPQDRRELSANRILELAEQASALGCRVFALTGGEPFFHRQFEAIVDGLLAHDAAQVVVLTNGMLLQQHAEAIRRWPKQNFHLQISVDGLEENHDRMRGSGMFDRLREGLKWLSLQGIGFTVSMCVEKDNVDDMAAVVDFAAEAGAQNVHFMWYFIRGKGSVEKFVPAKQIVDRLIQAAQNAQRHGIGLDNIDALKTQVFAPVGTIHDGSTSGWESLAVGFDGKLYPSPALVGIDSVASELGDDLAKAWRSDGPLEKLRRYTAANLSSPWRFILGGGDSDHSYMHSGKFLGHDPYWPLYEKTALWLIAGEASKQRDDGPPGLRLKMGDILESCGSHGPIAMVHSNCLLSPASNGSRAGVKQFYTDAVKQEKKNICNPVAYPEEFVEHIPTQFRCRGYGCGSPVLDANITHDERIVDLGSGMGLECFIAAKLVGRTGHVIGIDMLDPMLDKARQGAAAVGALLGYDNIEFQKGYLESLPLEDKSVDVVMSNCVLNLSSNKRRTFAEIFRVLREGGRLVISDVVCETDPDASIRNDEALRGECIAGALTQRDLFGLLGESGFVATKVIKRFPYRVVQKHPFFSMTFQAYKPADSGMVRVMYRGPFASIVTHKGTLLSSGIICDITRDEVVGCDGELYILDDNGAATNIGMDTSCCCSTPSGSETEQPCCSPSTEAKQITDNEECNSGACPC